ncbi:4-hydroxy-tetrahydrodipicolinate synthase [Serratia symbiotica]|nr:4-hydroxy-tetrahydrodipicolinate synthase [Serratia symbiotica]
MLRGSIVALVTPMNSKSTIDRVSLKKLVNYHVSSGTSAIVSVGTTGESATLTRKEHIDVVLQTLELADGRIPVIVGTGANATSEAISLTRCFEHTSVVGCLTVTPYYNKPTQEGLYQHFKAIAESTALPQILYNVPSRTGCDLLPKTIAKLAKINNIVAVKEATGNLSRVSQIQHQVNDENFILLSGDDSSGLDFMRLGGQGIISVTANVAAREMAQICALAAQGNFSKAERLHQYLMPLHQQLFVEANPIPVKWACKALGLLATDTLRLPMTPLSEASHPAVEKALKSTGLL